MARPVGMLQPLFLRRASVATTLRANIRSIYALAAWADALGSGPWELGVEELALFLCDAGRRGLPKTLWAKLLWAKEVFEFPWPLHDPLVEAQRQLSSGKREECRKQAPPLTITSWLHST